MFMPNPRDTYIQPPTFKVVLKKTHNKHRKHEAFHAFSERAPEWPDRALLHVAIMQYSSSEGDEDAASR